MQYFATRHAPLALVAVGLFDGLLVLDGGRHVLIEGGDVEVVVGSVLVVGVRGVDDLEDDVRLLSLGGTSGGVADDLILVHVLGLDLECQTFLGLDGVGACDLELLLLLIELTAVVLGDEVGVLDGLGHKLGGGYDDG